ncbi:DUF2247 family protein [Pseudomonas brassicacearum]|uniref:DUF2247 family protein n=1 Tax=Pseudomonas brassicacearum TaxID=930166 RepID=UPI0005192334|nr:DUF2247 family protein [Pseudomonas brassicacearum]KAB0528149.1 DUF2247 family protein [Pseudomonas brassicacearum subsp. brassicacearum]NJP59648.1 DUF2247 family protein [Pseudomonas brassicacearum]
MSPFKILIGLGLMCWSTLVFGFRRGWVKREDIFDYALNQLVSSSHASNENVAIIAGAEDLSDDELIGLILTLESTNNASDLDKWRLGFLLWIEASDGSDKEKINLLQKAYADFDYPEDMSSCSVYSQDEISPLLAMSDVAAALKERFLLGRSGADHVL